MNYQENSNKGGFLKWNLNKNVIIRDGTLSLFLKIKF